MDIFRKAYRELNPDEVQAMNEIKSEADKLYTMLGGTVLDSTVNADPHCMALAKTKLEEAVMWATKAITG